MNSALVRLVGVPVLEMVVCVQPLAGSRLCKQFLQDVKQSTTFAMLIFKLCNELKPNESCNMNAVAMTVQQGSCSVQQKDH